MAEKYYAKVEWAVEDIQALRAGWSERRCQEFLVANEKYIEERLVELGWEVIESLITFEEAEERRDGNA